MKNPYTVLYQKQMELNQVHKEVVALRIAIELLHEESDAQGVGAKAVLTAEPCENILP